MIGAPVERDLAARIVATALRGNLRATRPESVASDAAVGQQAVAAFDAAIESVSGSAEAVDLLLRSGLRPRFLGPSVETALMVAVIGVRRGWNDERVCRATIAALFADVGMLKLPPESTAKPGALNAEEMRVMRLHPVLGAEMVEPLARTLAPQIGDVSLQHHERIDGGGYPHGLEGHAILEEAQAVGICHLYVAATHERPYRETLPPAKAIALIEGLAGAAWDPRIVRAFVDGVAPYPVGTLVRLSSGDCGVVRPGGAPLRPLVEVRWGADGSTVPPRVLPASTTGTGLSIIAVGH